MTLRICILEADRLQPQLAAVFHSYGEMFKNLFSKQAPTCECTVFDVVNGHYPSENQCFDAYLVTGSKADSFANDPWIHTLRDYLGLRYAKGDKLLGVCFGHQIIALTIGAKTERAWQG